MASSWRDSAATPDAGELSSGAAGCEGPGDSDGRKKGREHAAVFCASDIGVTRAVLLEAGSHTTHPPRSRLTRHRAGFFVVCACGTITDSANFACEMKFLADGLDSTFMSAGVGVAPDIGLHIATRTDIEMIYLNVYSS